MISARTGPPLWSILAALVLILIGSLRIAGTYYVFSHTIDEVAHIAAGMQWLDQHKYNYEDQHPPVARVVGALVPYLAGERSHHDPNMYLEGFKLLGWGAHYDRVLALGRSGILLFFWIGSAAVFLWAYRVAGALAGVFALAFFTTLPPILAHSGLITTDMALAAFTTAAVVASLFWVTKPNRARTILLGVLLACAVLSKFSSLVFLPAAWLVMYAWYIFCDRPGLQKIKFEIKQRIPAARRAAVIAAIIIWVGYRFTFGPIAREIPLVGGLRLPAEHMFSGIYDVWHHNKAGHESYLLGKISSSGFWDYFPVILAVKTPAGTLILLIATCAAAIRRRRRELGMALAFASGILLVAMPSQINIGVRHILPIYSAFAVICGVGFALVIKNRSRWRIPVSLAAGLLLIWQVISSIRIHPDYLAYTNELAGSKPENILADSDLDWGQDMDRLADFFARAGVTEAAISTLNSAYGVDLGHQLPKFVPVPNDGPKPGWNAVSVSFLDLNQRPSWAKRIPPTRRIGRTIFLWYVAPVTQRNFPEATPKPARKAD